MPNDTNLSSTSLHSVSCGICKCHPAQYPGKTFYCPSCVNFKLLKYNLNNINLDHVNSIAIDDINKILKVCFGTNVKQFLLNYINTSTNNTENKMDNTNVSIAAVARLAFMLMQVEIVKEKEHIKTVSQLIQTKRTTSQKLETKIQMLKEKKLKKQKLINIHREKIQPKLNKEISKVLEDTHVLQLGIVTRQHGFITIRQMKNFYDLIYLWNIKIINKKSLIILYTPIISITDIAKYSMDLILQSFMKSSEFVDTVSRIFSVDLPFAIKTRNNNFSIGDISYKFKDLDDIFYLNKLQMLRFCIGISRLILNAVILLQKLNKIKTSHFNNMSLEDLLSYDQLLITLINSLKENGFGEEIRQRKDKLDNSYLYANKYAKRKESSSWANWFTSQKKKEVLVENDDSVKNNTIERYSIKSSTEIKDILDSCHTQISDGKSKYKISHSAMSSGQSASIPASAISANDLIHDERRLAEEVYCFLVEEMQMQKDQIEGEHTISEVGRSDVLT